MADKTGIRVINLSQVVGDFRQYDANTKKEFKRVLDRYATIIKLKQFSILKRQVKVWTGNLGNSIGFRKRGYKTREIGPNLNPGSSSRKVGMKKSKPAVKKKPNTIKKNKKSIKPRSSKFVNYASFIESGGQPYNNPAAARFPGYWYVRDSTKGVRNAFSGAIKRVIEKSQKK